MLEIVLCEDNEKVLAGIESMIRRIIRDHGLQAIVKYEASSVEEFESFFKIGSANFFIMDVDLRSSVNGLDLANRIRQKYKNSYIVFLTAHLEYVFQSFKVRPFNYLAKPVTFEILERVVLDVYADYLENYMEKDNACDILEIKSFGVLYRVKLCDIILIERQLEKSQIHLVDGNIFISQSLSKLEEMLNDKRFIRCHKGFICNRHYITEYRPAKNEILLRNGFICPIGRRYKKGLTEIV